MLTVRTSTEEQRLIQAGIRVASLELPAPPLLGWEVISESNVGTISPRIPVLTSGRLLVHM